MTFEEKMQRLNELTAMLENSQCTLDESLAYYEEGVKLAKELKVQLAEYEQRVASIAKEGNEDE